MSKPKRLIAGTSVAAAAVLLFWYSSHESDLSPTSGATGARSGELSSATANLQPLAEQPEVSAYLQRGADKQQLQEFFAGAGDMNADAAWALIERLEQEQRVLGFEALHLKLAWLETQHESRAAFEAAAQALMESYRQRAESETPYRPEDIPGFSDYKARELAILDQVNQMQRFPNGMSREEYLREQLLEARLEAYGEKR